MTTKEKITDLSGRFYYCSNNPDGRKMRKELEKEIKKLEKLLEKENKE